MIIETRFVKSPPSCHSHENNPLVPFSMIAGAPVEIDTRSMIRLPGRCTGRYWYVTTRSLESLIILTGFQYAPPLFVCEHEIEIGD